MSDEIEAMLLLFGGAICSIWAIFGIVVTLLYKEELEAFFKKRAEAKKEVEKAQAKAEEAPPLDSQK